MNTAHLRKYLAGLGIALATSVVLVFLLSKWGLFQQIELLLLNLRHEVRYAREGDTVLTDNVQLQTAREGKSPDIHIIKMDEHAFSAFGPFPWKRSTYARPLEKFSRGQLTVSLSWNGVQIQPMPATAYTRAKARSAAQTILPRPRSPVPLPRPMNRCSAMS